MKIYLCARYSCRLELIAVREKLQASGHIITSRWLDTDWGNEPSREHDSAHADPEYRAEYAVKDLEDVAAANCLIAFTEKERGGRGGRHIEVGAALALKKIVLLVGPKENLFHDHPLVCQYMSTEEVLSYLLEEKVLNEVSDRL